MIVKKEDFQIIQAGENGDEIFLHPIREIIGKKLTDFISKNELEEIHSKFERPVWGRLPFLMSFPNGPHMAYIKSNEGYYIVEIEKQVADGSRQSFFLKMYQDLRFVITSIEQASTVEETCEIAAKELKKISGFDKVMIYRFDEEWNGEVIAEEKEEGMDAYLHLKFPASDIPKQARDLYKNTPFRLIPNIRYQPVKLVPVLNPLTGGFTDLSDSNLRSVAGVHLEYLENMKVIASMSTRIMKDGELWGLIACHHREAKFLDIETCSVFEILSNIISGRISASYAINKLNFLSSRQEQLGKVKEAIFREGNLFSGLRSVQDSLPDLLGAKGVYININKEELRLGTLPSEPEIEDLILWLESKDLTNIFHQPSLSSEFEPAEYYAKNSSGLLALPLGSQSGNFLLAFRPEAESEVSWGGNPAEAIRFEKDSKKYHPRASFDIWKQKVTKTSKSWTEEELQISREFRNFAMEFILNKMYSS